MQHTLGPHALLLPRGSALALVLCHPLIDTTPYYAVCITFVVKYDWGMEKLALGVAYKTGNISETVEDRAKVNLKVTYY